MIKLYLGEHVAIGFEFEVKGRSRGGKGCPFYSVVCRSISNGLKFLFF